MSLEHDWNKWSTKAPSLVRQYDSVHYQGEGRGQWPPRCCAIAFSLALCYLWMKELGHCPLMLDKVCKLLKAFQVATSGWYFPVQKGLKGLSLQYLHICFRLENVLSLWGCPWRCFSCWLQISPFFRSIDIMPQVYFVSNTLKFSYFLEKTILVTGRIDPWHKMLLKYGVYVS